MNHLTQQQSVKYNANRIQSFLRIKGIPKIGPLKLAHPNTDGKKFQQLCRDIANEELSTGNITLLTGLGISKYPWRALTTRCPSPARA